MPYAARMMLRVSAGLARTPFLRAAALSWLLAPTLSGVGLLGCEEPAGEPDAAMTDAPETPDAAPSTPRLGMNDVSILFPLPAADTDEGHLRPADDGGRGPLLPMEVFDAIPTFPVTPADGLRYARLRVLAARFDACGGSPRACHPEIRLVMQPTLGATSRDSALHLFYRLDDTQTAEIVQALRALQSLAPELDPHGPLDVNPALVAQGLDGPYAQALRALLLQHIGAENLVRVTFFLRAPPAVEVWFLGGFDRTDGVLSAMNIVAVGATTQRVIFAPAASGYDYELTPPGTTPEDGSALYTAALAAAASEPTRADAIASFLRVENPTLHAVDDLPCAGCHISTYVTSEAARTHGVDLASIEGAYTSSRDLTLRGDATNSPSSLRAFGWFANRPMIAQRTVNETAAVLDDLEARFPTP